MFFNDKYTRRPNAGMHNKTGQHKFPKLNNYLFTLN